MVTVGFIGLGTMGGKMATNLQKAGYQLVVHDVRPEAATAHLAAGAKWAATPKAVAEASDVVLTSLPGPPEVEAVARRWRRCRAQALATPQYAGLIAGNGGCYVRPIGSGWGVWGGTVIG